MARPLVPACLLLAAVVLGGCGGGGDAPVLVPGDYFPLAVGTTWTYTTSIEVETASGLVTTTGTFTRDLGASVPVVVNGQSVQAREISQTATVATVPDISDIAGEGLTDAVNFLFSPAGGLQPVRAYYRQLPASGGLQPRIALLAEAENAGPITELPHPVPFLLNPTYHGTAQTVSAPFVPLPLMPPLASMSGLTVHDKLLDYGDIAGLNGPTHSVVSIYYFSADADLGGVPAVLAGRGRSYLLNGLGYASGGAEFPDVSYTVQVGGEWARVTVVFTLVSMS